jgi:hypothetical protein
VTIGVPFTVHPRTHKPDLAASELVGVQEEPNYFELVGVQEEPSEPNQFELVGVQEEPSLS